MRATILVSLMLLFATSLSAQQYLYIQKGNEVPHARIGVNERVQFKTREGDDWIKGLVQNIGNESITVGRVTYPFSEIVTFRRRNSFLYTVGTAGLGGGAFFTGIFLVNGLINDSSPIITERQMAVGASLMAAGAIVQWFSKKTYKLEKGWHWKVIDLEQDLE